MDPNDNQQTVVTAERQIPRPVQLFIQALIIYSIITLALETVPELKTYQRFFQVSEIVVVTIFTIEYFWRWALAPNWRTYPFHPMAIVDLLAILPFYLRLGLDLRGLRAIRLLRLFRLLKLARYSRSCDLLATAAKRCAPELVVFGMIAGIIILISAMALYYAEHNAQPEVYRSIPETLWWAVVTLTTVGYGDVYPQTLLGRIVASFIMLLGISIVAIPTGIISSTLTDLVRERRRSSPDDK